MGSTPGIRVLYPTRLIVFGESTQSNLDNCNTLPRAWKEAPQATMDTQAKSRIQRVAAQMIKFTYLFTSVIGDLVLKYTVIPPKIWPSNSDN